MKPYKTHLIKPPRPADDQLRHKQGNTGDIIETVLFADKQASGYTKEFAATLKGSTVIETCRNIWEFVKKQIPYVLDKRGYQWVKSPGRLWADKAGDCKSFSVFTASCLNNLGITCGYRFTSYDPKNPTATHVYVFVKEGAREIILDSVWDGPFNTEKKYAFKKDIMSEVHYLGTIGRRSHKVQRRLTRLMSLPFPQAGQEPVTTEPPPPPRVVITGNNDYTNFVLPRPIDQISDGEMDLLLTRQRLAIEKQNSARVGGPFNFQQPRYDAAIEVVNKALANINNPDYIMGIGRQIDERENAIGKKKGVGKFFQKIGKGVKKGLKAVTKVVTAPLRLIGKGVMEVYLPKASFMFLYLFADAPDKLPDVMKAKRKKAEKFKKFVVKGLGMKDKHFMAIIRNSLTKKLGMSPEKYLADALRSRVSGIGNPKTKARKSSSNKAHPKNKTQARQKVMNSSSPVKRTIHPDENKIVDRSDNSGNGFDPEYKSNPNPVIRKGKVFSEQNVTAAKNVATKLATGDPIGAALAAIMWIIQKIAGGGKKKNDPDFPGTFNANDFPDVERDAANVFEYKDMQEDFSTLEQSQKQQVKDVATNLMVSNANERTIDKVLDTVTSYLTPKQRQEVKYEIHEGPEAIDEYEANDLAREIKDNGRDLSNAEANGGGSAGAGLCNC